MMTKERLEELRMGAREAEDRATEARKAYLEAAIEFAQAASPYKRGDRILVAEWNGAPETNRHAFAVLEVLAGHDATESRRVEYRLRAIRLKKDGTASRQHRPEIVYPSQIVPTGAK